MSVERSISTLTIYYSSKMFVAMLATHNHAGMRNTSLRLDRLNTLAIRQSEHTSGSVALQFHKIE
jgi:hypothetical protein